MGPPSQCVPLPSSLVGRGRLGEGEEEEGGLERLLRTQKVGGSEGSFGSKATFEGVCCRSRTHLPNPRGIVESDFTHQHPSEASLPPDSQPEAEALPFPWTIVM